MFFRHLESLQSDFLANLKALARDAEQLLSRISGIFPAFTLHDIDHSIRVADYIYRIVQNNLEDLSELEIYVIIVTCILHDIGMYATQDEIKAIKNDEVTYGGIKFQKLLAGCGNNSDSAVQDLIRRYHGKRSYDIVTTEFKEYLVLPNQSAISFTEDVALICQSHTTDFTWLQQKLSTDKVLGPYNFNPGFCAVLLRLGDILDFDTQRTPLFLYKLISPSGISKDEWLKHFNITNNEKVVSDPDTGLLKIVFYGDCFDPKIHRLVLTYFDWVNSEIHSSINAVGRFDQRYRLKLKFPLENKVIPHGYTISDLKLTIDFIAISHLLMGENIYGNKKFGLRELLQYSIDACGVRRSIENTKRDAWQEPYSPKILIIIDDEHLIVKDNGTGMSYEIIKKYFLNIGKSFYQSEDFRLNGYDYSPIGKFGIGFLSCFMLSYAVKIKTKHFNDKSTYILDLVKDSEYICVNESDEQGFEGTEVILSYNDCIKVFESEDNIVSFLKYHILSEGYDIRLVNSQTKKFFDINTNLKSGLKATHHKIDVSDYLIGIEGYIGISFWNKIKDSFFSRIKLKGRTFTYERIEDYFDLVEINTETFDPTLICKDGYFYSVTVPIIDKYSRFDSVMEVLEDFDETIDRLSDDIDHITILVKTEDIDDFDPEDRKISLGHEIIYEKIFFDHLIELGHTKSCETKLYIEKHYVISYDDSMKVNIFYNKTGETRFSFAPNTSHKIYVKNIYVTAYNFMNAFSQINDLKIEDYRINIKNVDASLNVSRNDLSQKDKNEIVYALQKVVYLYLLNHVLADPLEKSTLSNFMEMYLSRPSKYIK